MPDTAPRTAGPDRFRAAEAALRAHPGVLDACVMERRDTNGTAVLVGYVTARDRAGVPAAVDGVAHVVWVSRLPRTADGAVDAAALARVPVWSAADSAAWEARLNALPGVAEAAVAVRPAGRARPRLHLADLLPGYRVLGGPTATAAGEHPALALRAVIGQALSDRPAEAHGAPLTPPPGFPATLAEALDRAAATPGAGTVHVAEDFSETVETYAALRDRARRVLGGLQRLGVAPGARVIVDASDSAAALPAFWAAVLGGMVPVPMQLRTPGSAAVERLHAVWDLLGRPPVVAPTATLATLAPLLPAHGLAALTPHDVEDLAAGARGSPAPTADPDAPALILLTSGSTGVPKGVVHSHRSLLTMVAAMTQTEAFGAADTSLNWMPLDHVGGAVFFMLLPIATTASQVHVRPDPVLREPLRWLDLVDRHRVSIAWAPNFAYGLIAEAVAGAADRRWELSCLRFLINAGEAVANATMVEFTGRLGRHGLREDAIRPSFGMTETASAILHSVWRPSAAPLPFADLGGPVPSAAARIVDEEGEILREGEIGQIELSGPQIFRGYHARPDLTEQAFRDGWFRTGDLGFLADGRLFVTGRDKDMIIVNGANFYSHEIETVVSAIPGLDRTCTAAVAVRDAGAVTDRIAVFFHAPEHGGDHGGDEALAALAATIRRRLPAELGVAPDFLVPLTPDRVPRTPIGKIRRPTLKDQFEAGAFDADVLRVERLTGGPATLPDWFSETVWSPLPPAPPAPRAAGETVLAFADAGSPLATAARAADPSATWITVTPGKNAGGVAFAPAGPRAWTIDPADPADYARLFAELAAQGSRPARILHAWSHGEGPAGAVADPVGALLRLGQALQRLAPAARPAELTVVASRAVAARPGEGTDDARAALPGLLAALAAELPGLACRLIDLPDAPSAAEAGALAAEWAAAPGEPEVALRAGPDHSIRRLAARFAPVDARVKPHAAAALPDGGVLLLAGGLGGIGRHLARHLLHRYGARLLLVGRTPEAALDAGRSGALAELRRLGEVAYAAADVTDPDALRAAVAVAAERWGRPLDGVFHFAGTGRPVPLAEETPEGIAAAIGARAAGTRALHALLAGRPDAPFVVAGSVAGALGGATMAGYAAATAAQAAVAADLARHDARVRFIAFSSWRDVGMSRGTTAPELLRAAGLFAIDPPAGLASVEAALGLPGRCLLAGVDSEHPRHAHRFLGPADAMETPAAFVAGPETLDPETLGGRQTLEDRFGCRFTAAVTVLDALPRAADGTVDTARLRRAIAGAGTGPGAAPAEAPRDHTERRLARVWESVLGVGEVGAHDDFFALGGNSLRAAQVAARVREAFRIDLPVAAVLTCPTIAALAGELRRLEPKPGFAEAVARRLDEIDRMTPEQIAALRATAAPNSAPNPASAPAGAGA